MDYKDYYQILGISKQATEKEIKAAYRKLARKYHPDMNSDSNAEDRFKDINEAHEVLGDAEKRSKYDQLGSDWRHWQQGGGQPTDFDWSSWQSAPNGQRVYVKYGNSGGSNSGFEDIFGGGFGQSNGDFSDFFETIFGGRNGGGGFTNRGGGASTVYQDPRGQRIHDVTYDLEISLKEAYQGAERLVDIDGRRLSVKIPVGAKTGTKVRIRGQATNSAAPDAQGDLYLRITVASDPRFRREGNDLHTTVSTDLYTAVLGGEVLVPTLTGQVNLKIPAGTQNGQTFRLRGKGMPKLNQANQTGDLFAHMVVEIPSKLSAKQQTLFKQLREMDV